MTLHLPRRHLLTGLASLLAAPAIVRASSLMPVVPVRPVGFTFRGDHLFLVHPSNGLRLREHHVSLDVALERSTQEGIADLRILAVSLNRSCLPVAGLRKTDRG